jgi:hypothetical protein
VAKFVVGFPWPAVAGGLLLLAIGSAGYAAWSREMTLRIEHETKTMVLHQGGLLAAGHDRTYYLSEIAGVQVLRVFIEGDFDVTTYEVNLVGKLGFSGGAKASPSFQCPKHARLRLVRVV